MFANARNIGDVVSARFAQGPAPWAPILDSLATYDGEHGITASVTGRAGMSLIQRRNN